MERAWTHPDDAIRFAFGMQVEEVPQTAVLLHKDRLDEIERLAGPCRRLQARWSCLLTSNEEHSTLFITTTGGASDVGDCILYLAASAIRQVLYTGTCGSLDGDVEIGQACLVTEGWAADSFVNWVTDPYRAVAEATPVVNSTKHIIVNRIQELLNARCHITVPRKRVFTTASQALESAHVVRDIRRLGAQVVDMESAVFLAVARTCQLHAVAMLWCTDFPQSSSSFYETPSESAVRARQETWNRWPYIVLATSRIFAASADDAEMSKQ